MRRLFIEAWMGTMKHRWTLATLSFMLVARSASAQHGRTVVDTVKSTALKNLIGDPPETRVRSTCRQATTGRQGSTIPFSIS